MKPIESVCLSLVSSAFMSSGAAAGFVAGAGAGFAGWLAGTGGAAGFAGAVAVLVAGGAAVVATATTATATATAVAAAGGGAKGVMASTLLLIAGVSMGGESGIGDPAVMVSAGSTVAGAVLGSFTANGALGGPAQAEIHSAKNAIASCGGGIQNTLVRDISSPIKVKQRQVNIICGNLRPRVRKADRTDTDFQPAYVATHWLASFAVLALTDDPAARLGL